MLLKKNKESVYARMWSDKKIRYVLIGSIIVWCALILATISGATAYTINATSTNGTVLTTINASIVYRDAEILQIDPYTVQGPGQRATGNAYVENGSFSSGFQFVKNYTAPITGTLHKLSFRGHGTVIGTPFVQNFTLNGYDCSTEDNIILKAGNYKGTSGLFTMSTELLCDTDNKEIYTYSMFGATNYAGTNCGNTTHWNDSNISTYSSSNGTNYCDANPASGSGTNGIGEMWLIYSIFQAPSPYNLTEFFSTTNGTIATGYINQSQYINTQYSADITVSSPGYIPYTTNNTVYGVYSYTLTPTNYTFFFRDEDNNSLITGVNVTLQLSGSSSGYNSSTSNGSLYIDSILQGTYLATVNAPGYYQRQFELSFDNTQTPSTLYLIGTANATAVRFTVLNQAYQPLTNATVNGLKKNLSGTNYYNVADCITDNNGECMMYLQLLTTTYRFLTEYGSVTRVSSDTVLSRDTYTIVLTTTSSSLESVLGSDNIQSSLVASGSIGSTVFTYTTNNPSNEPVTSTLVVYRRYGNRLTELQRSTSSSVSNIIVSSAVNASIGDEIVAEGYVVVEGSSLLTHQTTVVDNAQGASLGASMLILVLCVVFTVIFMFAWNPIAPMLMFSVLLLFFNSVNMISIGLPAVISIIVIIFIAVYRMRSV